MTDAPDDTPNGKEFGEARERSKDDVAADRGLVEYPATAALLTVKRDWMSIATLIAMVILAISLYSSIRATTNAQDDAKRADQRAARLELQLEMQQDQTVCRSRFANEDARLAALSDIGFNTGLVNSSVRTPGYIDRFAAWSEILNTAREAAASARSNSPKLCETNPAAQPLVAVIPPIPE